MADPADPPSVITIDRDIPCMACGYDLRGLQADGQCPECGGSVRESVTEFDRGVPRATLAATLQSIRFILLAMGLAWLGGNAVIWHILRTLPPLWEMAFGFVCAAIAWGLILRSVWILATVSLPGKFKLPRWLTWMLLGCTAISVSGVVIVLVVRMNRLFAATPSPFPFYFVRLLPLAAFLGSCAYFEVLARIATALRYPTYHRISRIIGCCAAILPIPMHLSVMREIVNLPPLLYTAVVPMPVIGYGSTIIVIFRNLFIRGGASTQNILMWLPIPIIAAATIWVVAMVYRKIARELAAWRSQLSA